jgi:hypothetical protein
VFSASFYSQASAVGCNILKVFNNDASRTYVLRNPGKGMRSVEFGGIFAEAWIRATTEGNAVSSGAVAYILSIVINFLNM